MKFVDGINELFKLLNDKKTYFKIEDVLGYDFPGGIVTKLDPVSEEQIWFNSKTNKKENYTKKVENAFFPIFCIFLVREGRFGGIKASIGNFRSRSPLW